MVVFKMVVLDIKGVKHRLNKEGKQTYRYQISLTKENLKELKIETDQIDNKQFKPVKILNIKEYENLQNLELVEKQRFVGSLNKTIEEQKEKIKDLENNRIANDNFKQKLQTKDDEILELRKQLKDRDNLINKNNSLSDKIKNLENNLDNINKEKAELSLNLEEQKIFKNKIKELKQTILDKDNKINDLAITLENLENTFETTTKTLKEKENKVKTISTENSRLLDKIKSLETELNETNNNNIRLSNKLKEYKGSQSQITDLQQTIAKQNDELKEKDIKTLELKVNHEKSINQLNNEIYALNQKIKNEKDHTQAIAMLEQKLTKQENKDTKKLKEKVNKKNSEIMEKNNEISDYKNQIIAINDEIKQLEKQLHDQEFENKNLLSKLETVEEQHAKTIQNMRYDHRETLTQVKKEKDKLIRDYIICSNLNASLITDLKHLHKLSFFDVLRKKHKSTIESAIKKEIPDIKKEFQVEIKK